LVLMAMGLFSPNPGGQASAPSGRCKSSAVTELVNEFETSADGIY
jgi:hypothetical protein